MKKGDKVRFLSEVGGGKVAGFQGKNIVLVEDEDGFEIPMPINEVVVVEQDDYAMGKMISAKMDAKQKAEEHANTELHQDSRSIKAILNEHENDVDMNVEEYDAADREITFVKQIQERTGGNKLSAYLAFVPIDIKDVTNTRFESYMVNDSNYYLRYTYLVAEGNAWTLKAEGEIEPNTKLFIEEFGREALNEMEHIAIRWVFLGMRVLPTTMSSRSLTDTLDPSLIFVSRTNMHSKGYCASVGTVRSSSARELKPPPWVSSRDDMAEVLRTGASSPMTAMGCPCGAAS